MYKGYLKSKGKKTVESFKETPENIVKFDTARRYDSYVGLLDDDYVMVDVDSIEESDLLLDIIEDLKIKCNILETDNGIHVYFKGYDIPANKIKWFTPIGIKVDIKLGHKNTADPLKIDGELRPWIMEHEELEPLPKWLYPVDKKYNPIDEISSGSRNQSLFNYILKLQSLNMSKPDIKETIRIVNRYMLDEPLPNNEISTILRDEAFLKQSFFKDKAFLHDKFAEYLISEYHIISIDDNLHVYDDGVYRAGNNQIERFMIREISNLKRGQRDEVLSYIKLKAPKKRMSSTRYICCQNGVYDLTDEILLPHSPDIVITNKIPTRYNEEAYSESVDQVLNNIAVDDSEVRLLIEEMIGYTLYRRNEYRGMFILKGDGQNGKSTLLTMIRNMIGRENVSSLDIKDVSRQFLTAELFGKLANIGDDISKQKVTDTSILKKLVTGDPTPVEYKGKDPFTLYNYSKLIFSANDVPKFDDTSQGFMSRINIVPLNANFSVKNKNFNPTIIDDLTKTEALEYLLQISIDGLYRVLDNRGFTKVASVERELELFAEDNNPLLSFAKEIEAPESLIDQEPKSIYLRYATWCVDNGIDALSQNQFTREINSMYKLKTKPLRVDGVLKRTFDYIDSK